MVQRIVCVAKKSFKEHKDQVDIGTSGTDSGSPYFLLKLWGLFQKQLNRSEKFFRNSLENEFSKVEKICDVWDIKQGVTSAKDAM